MAQVLTNNTGLQYALESSLGVLPGSPDWKVTEPNDIGAFGAEITTVSRNPISKLRQRRKGTRVDLDSNAEFEADTTFDSMLDFAAGFMFANATNADMTFRAADAQVGPAGFTIPSATAAQAAKFQYTAAGPISLVHAAGYTTTGNNSPLTVFEIAADVAATDTVIEVTGITTETAPTNAEVSLAGIRAEAGDLDLSISGTIGTITSGNGASVTPIDFTTLGLTVGQRIHIGGLTATNRFGSTAGGSNDSYGSARIRTIAAGTLTVDKMDTTLSDSDGTDTGSAGAEVQCDLLFGRFVRNVSVDHADYNAQSFQFEGSYPNLYETDPPTPVANPDGFEYVVGALPNTWSWAMALTDKSVSTFSFIAKGADDLVDNGSRKTNASTARLPLFTEAINTSIDCFRLGITDVDETGLTTDFKDITALISNNVTPEKVLCVSGARFMNNGNFDLNVTGEALFTSPLVINRIKNNTTVTMDWLVKNDDGACSVDVPSAVIKDGAKTFPINESVRFAFDVEAFVDSMFLTSIGVSFFPVYPAAA